MNTFAPEVLSEITTRLRTAGCVFADEETALLAAHAAETAKVSPFEVLTRLADRRVAGEPLEVIIGWVAFRGQRVRVASGVFVPRRRTEYLVELALPHCFSGTTVVDVCCGTGAIGLALATEAPGIRVFGADVDPTAVAVARRNLEAVAGHVWCGDLFAPLPDSLRGAVDLITANAPYVPTDDISMMPTEARDHEPHHTLDGGIDGVDLHRRIAISARQWLRPGGRLFIETSRRQADLTADAMRENGLSVSIAESDELSATVAIGTAGHQ